MKASRKLDRVRIAPEDGDGVSAESGAVDVRLDVSVAHQVEDVNVGQEAVGGGVEGGRPAPRKVAMDRKFRKYYVGKAKPLKLLS